MTSQPPISTELAPSADRQRAMWLRFLTISSQNSCVSDPPEIFILPIKASRELHPLGLCNNSDEEDLHQYGWVGVVKLEDPALEPQPCLSIFGKAKKAIQRGAIAVIFDVTENPGAIDQLSEGAEEPLSHPVVVIHNEEARKLMSIVNRQTMARARIQHSKDPYLPQVSSSYPPLGAKLTSLDAQN
ncbi:E3 ubiquitin-protein ligase znrf3 [Branchiostoma belcheri]|nr:E3 ubiquitin-protein ligase znrf3 [Branchiostoma belcheri]